MKKTHTLLLLLSIIFVSCSMVSSYVKSSWVESYAGPTILDKVHISAEVLPDFRHSVEYKLVPELKKAFKERAIQTSKTIFQKSES
ncbi:MAG: hypothetical protein VYB44_01300 [Bacteroidota bacterium]|nr:hypothetical protein [Bacteroidota bacterium]